ncbi:MAG TPA: SPW repeat protein [Xanthobacteraceae bacterium]|nr:SPW repeat protein [Xanthobacteraceae bacterium]
MTAFNKRLANACLNALYLMVAAGLIVSPFLLERDASAAAIRNQVILGLLFGVFALWSMATEERTRAPIRTKAN